MKQIAIVLIGMSLAQALSYVESSNGLDTPGLESDRTELEMVDVDLDGHIDIVSIGDHGAGLYAERGIMGSAMAPGFGITT